MSAFDSGAFSTDAFSVDAFDFGVGPQPPAPEAETFGQQPWLVSRARQRTKEDVRKSRVAHGIIKEVAQRQAKSLGLDDLQKKEELLAELRLRNIEARAEHFEALALRREALISAEIAAYQEYIRKQDEDAIAMMILLASSI